MEIVKFEQFKKVLDDFSAYVKSQESTVNVLEGKILTLQNRKLLAEQALADELKKNEVVLAQDKRNTAFNLSESVRMLHEAQDIYAQAQKFKISAGVAVADPTQLQKATEIQLEHAKGLKKKVAA